MNKERLKLVRNTIKELENKNILVLYLNIVLEIDCQLNEKISDDDYIKLYNEIEYAYLKLEGVSLDNVVSCAIDNLEKILNDDEDFNLRDESCWY